MTKKIGIVTLVKVISNNHCWEALKHHNYEFDIKLQSGIQYVCIMIIKLKEIYKKELRICWSLQILSNELYEVY